MKTLPVESGQVSIDHENEEMKKRPISTQAKLQGMHDWLPQPPCRGGGDAKNSIMLELSAWRAENFDEGVARQAQPALDVCTRGLLKAACVRAAARGSLSSS
uniref:Uncharacterized protein n=1 Tax=Alexandrium monilatum TaxID=311494 RepID=A0A7S4R694_9DINO